MISLAYFLIFGIRTVTISAWYLPWLQWSFPDDDEKEAGSIEPITPNLRPLDYGSLVLAFENG